MKNYSLRFILLIIAAILGVVVSGLILAFSEVPYGNMKWRIAAIFFCISFISSVALLYFVQLFVFKKIERLLDTVRGFRSHNDRQVTARNHAGNEVDKLSREISAWADDRKNEIERLHKLEV